MHQFSFEGIFSVEEMLKYAHDNGTLAGEMNLEQGKEFLIAVV